MNVLIIEDEIPAQNVLVRLLKKYYPDFNVLDILDSTESAISFLSENTPPPDLIFMDVELSDGNCFEIFKAVNITSPVIITTAYENYALDAFKTKCVDYLLKPFDELAFKESVDRCLQFYLHSTQHTDAPSPDITSPTPNSILSYVHKAYKHRFTIKLGSQIVMVDVNNIAYFFSEEKSTYIVTTDSKQYLSDLSLDAIESEVDPASFFKISRGCLAGIKSIYTISKYFNSRLKVILSPPTVGPIIVPRSRVQSFLEWLEGRA